MISLNGGLIPVSYFPNKEPMIHISFITTHARNKGNYITWEYEHMEEIFYLAMLVNQMQSMNYKTDVLYIPYLPCCRMDRVNGEYVVSLETMASIINTFNISTVRIGEVHSQRTLDLIDNSKDNQDVYNHIFKATQLSGANCTFYPDFGASP